MTRVFLEDVFAGYLIQQYADEHRLRLIRVRFNRKGSIVYAMKY